MRLSGWTAVPTIVFAPDAHRGFAPGRPRAFFGFSERVMSCRSIPLSMRVPAQLLTSLDAATLQKADLVAGVVARAFVGEAEDLFILQKRLDAVGELDLTARAGFHALQHLEDAGRED